MKSDRVAKRIARLELENKQLKTLLRLIEKHLRLLPLKYNKLISHPKIVVKRIIKEIKEEDKNNLKKAKRI